MFRIKICGVKSAIDARAAAAAGADAIGLNFYSGSRRYLTPEAAEEVAAVIPQGVLKVGVFVNAAPDFACDTTDRLHLDLVQLAGDETPESMRELGGRSLVKVLRPRLESPDDARSMILRFLEQTARFDCTPKLLLIDADQPGEFGGTGRTVHWPSLARLWDDIRGMAPPLVLAGGLNPENVREAIETVGPAAVDVASGVESSPGLKDHERMRNFVAAASAGFESVSVQPPQASSLKPRASAP